VLFWLLAPTYFSRQLYSQQIEDRVATMWRVHKNRKDRGLGSTYQSNGYHESLELQDSNMAIPTTTMAWEQFMDSAEVAPRFVNPFNRWHEAFGKSPAMLGDIDDYTLASIDEFERAKIFKPDASKVMGSTDVNPMEDNDEKYQWYDGQGETIFTPPPDINLPAIDHGLDEDHIWAIERDLMGTPSVVNRYADMAQNPHKVAHAPLWGQKLAMMAFYKSEKMAKFFRHWEHRLGLESLKLLHTAKYGANPTESERAEMAAEVSKYIEACYEAEEQLGLGEVFVTDHQPPEPKFVTQSEEEDREHFEYVRSLEAYNDTSDKQKLMAFTAPRSKYPRGSYLQRTFEPLAFVTKDENGSNFLELTEKDLAHLDLQDEQKAQELYRVFTEGREEFTPAELADQSVIDRIVKVRDLAANETHEELDRVMMQEILVMKEGQEYNFSQDMKELFRNHLKENSEVKIFKTIPDHYFWDIKKPLHPKPIIP
jgi:hypothetical protein